MDPLLAGEKSTSHGCYFIFSRTRRVGWRQLWSGELFCMDDETAAKDAEIKAHQALDRLYLGGVSPSDQVRLTLSTKTVSEKVVIVPPIWE